MAVCRGKVLFVPLLSLEFATPIFEKLNFCALLESGFFMSWVCHEFFFKSVVTEICKKILGLLHFFILKVVSKFKKKFFFLNFFFNYFF